MATINDYSRAPSVSTSGLCAVRNALTALWETSGRCVSWARLSTVSITRKSVSATSSLPLPFCWLGGIEALILQLRSFPWSNRHLLTPEQYDQLFTMHGHKDDDLPLCRAGLVHWVSPIICGRCCWGSARHGAAAQLAVLSIGSISAQRHFSVCPPSLLAADPMTAGSTMSRWPRAPTTTDRTIDLLRPGHDPAGASPPPLGAIEFIVVQRSCACAAARHVGKPGSRSLIWGTLDRQRSQPDLRHPCREPGVLSACVMDPAISARTSPTWGRADLAAAVAAPVLDVRHIPGSMPSCCRQWAMVSVELPVFCRRPLVGYTCRGAGDSRDHGAGLWRVGAPHVCHQPCRLSLSVSFLPPPSFHRRSPSAVGVFRPVHDDLDGAAVVQTTPFLFFASFIHPVHDWQGQTGYKMTGSRAGGLAVDR